MSENHHHGYHLFERASQMIKQPGNIPGARHPDRPAQTLHRPALQVQYYPL